MNDGASVCDTPISRATASAHYQEYGSSECLGVALLWLALGAWSDAVDKPVEGVNEILRYLATAAESIG